MMRILAVLAAVAMIAGALMLRGGDDGSADPDDGPAPTTGSADDLRITCATELAEACTALAEAGATVSVEPAGRTAQALVSAPQPPIDGWLTPDPWPAIVDDRRQRAGLAPILGEAAEVARTLMVVVMWEERATTLTDHCRGTVTWQCLGNAAPRLWSDIGGPAAWGPLKPAHANPTTSATGLAAIGWAAAGYFSRADLSTADFADPAFRSWFSGLERAVPLFDVPSGSLLQRMLQFGPAALDLVVTTEAEAVTGLARAAGSRSEIGIQLPMPLAALTAVAVPVGSTDRARDASARMGGDDVRQAIADGGWRTGEDAADETLPDTDGLPSPGALQALTAVWEEVTR